MTREYNSFDVVEGLRKRMEVVRVQCVLHQRIAAKSKAPADYKRARDLFAEYMSLHYHLVGERRSDPNAEAMTRQLGVLSLELDRMVDDNTRLRALWEDAEHKADIAHHNHIGEIRRLRKLLDSKNG